jgi:Tfp pilus assembly protein PilF
MTKVQRILVVLCVLTVSGALAACRQSVDDRMRRADAFLEQQRYPEAIIELRSALQVNPNLGNARIKLADAYIQTNELPNALREYVRAADLLPERRRHPGESCHVLAARRQVRRRQNPGRQGPGC